MAEQKLIANDIGLETLGNLSFYSGWANSSGFDEIHHIVSTDTLFVEPKSVLFWDAEPDRLNSLKRFAHMLRWRAVAPLNGLEPYQESLSLALAQEGMDQPGLVLDSLLVRPLGTTPVALLLAVGGATLINQPFPRLRLIAPIVAVPILSFAYSMLILGIQSAMQPGIHVPDASRLFLPGALYDAIIAMFLGPLAITLHDRRMPTERVDW